MAGADGLGGARAAPQAAAPAEDAISEAQVADYLRGHPNFLNRHPDLLSTLAPPAGPHGDGVIDLQHAMLERLRGEVSRLRVTQSHLIATSRGNLTSQMRVHNAVMALIGAESFEHFIHIVTADFAETLDADAVALCVEAIGGDSQPAPPRGVRVLDPGEVERHVGAGREARFMTEVNAEAAIFGATAPLVRSAAFLRLDISPRTPPGMLALGARRAGKFYPGQGAELLCFLAGVVAHGIGSWLDLPR